MGLKPILFFILLFFSVEFIAYGQKTIVIDSISKMHIGKDIAVFIPTKEISFPEVLNQAEFIPSIEKVPNLGMVATSIWIKFSIQNKSWSNALALDLENNTLDEAELFFQKKRGGKFEHAFINKKLPLNARTYKGAEFLFRIDRIDTNAQIYYLRIKSNQPIILPISINFPTEQLLQTIQKNWYNGIYFGIVLIMALYNFFIFLSVKDRSYIYYVGFIFFAGLTQLTLKGLSFQYFWPNYPFLETHTMILFADISGIAALLFTRQFLNIKKKFPKINILIILFICLFLISIVLGLAHNLVTAFLIMQSATGISSLLILFISIYVLKKEANSSAVYFIIAWFALIAGSLIYILKDYNILPYNDFTNYSVQISSAIEMTLLSFALANRINILKKEEESARLAVLQLAQQNERIVKEQNILLEENVAKRTEELQHKNKVLNKTYEDLKQAQTSLVAAEKMSSLGQLTAGIAHEINNPINFVAANISPLKRDIHQLFDTITKIEAIGLQDKPAEDKIKEIAEYKEEQDLEYVQMEITHLLKGIHEGASRTADIVKGLRTFSRLDEDDLKSASINDGLNSTLTISSNLLKGIEVDTELGDIPLVTCYPGKLNQVFLNIITNAIFAIRKKFGDNSGGRLSVRTYAGGDFVFVSIKDDGTGMDEATKAKLFEPFFTTKKVGEGTGLGMSIAFTIIEQHYAELTVDSIPGEGTEFILRLPVHPPRRQKKNEPEDFQNNDIQEIADNKERTGPETEKNKF